MDPACQGRYWRGAARYRRARTLIASVFFAACTPQGQAQTQPADDVARAVAGDAPLTIVPAWEGHYRAERGTELTFRSVARDGGTLTISVASAPLTILLEERLEPGIGRELAVPVRPSSNELTVKASIGRAEPIERRVALVALDEPLVGLVADNTFDIAPWLASDDDFKPLPVAVSELPRTAAGYEPLMALVVGRDVRAGLEQPQREALGTYLQGCGRVFALSAQTASALAAAAGCAGRMVTQIDGPAGVERMLRAEPPSLPRYEDLRRLVDEPPALVSVAAVFLAFYAVIVIMLAGRNTRRGDALLLGAPIAASALMLGIWHDNAPESRLVIWLEQRGEESARYRAVLDFLGQGTAAIELRLPADTGLPLLLADQPTEWLRANGADTAGTLRWRPTLFGRQSLGFNGASEARAPLEIVVHDAALGVVNRGARPSTEAIFAHARRYYRVPVLAPGATWMPDDDTLSLSRVDVPVPLTRIREPAVLMPLAVDALPAGLPAADRVVGWIVNHQASEDHP